MKESISILGVNSSGLRELTSALPPKTDIELYEHALSLNGDEQIKYLKEALKSKPGSYMKSMGLLIDLVKGSDPEYACDLILCLAQYSPINPTPYYLLASAANANDAFSVAKDLLGTAKWLCHENFKEKIDDVNKLLLEVEESIASEKEDKSDDMFWKNKSTDKYWILERLYYRANTKMVADYSFKLLDEQPDDLRNYESVYKVFSIDNKGAEEFISYINKSDNLSDEIKYLYLGLANHNLLNIEDSIHYLEESLKENNTNIQALTYLAVNHLFKNDLQSFFSTFKKIKPTPNPINLALYFIYCSLSKMKLEEEEFPNQKNISSEITKILSKLHEYGYLDNVDFLIKQFIELNYQKVLPNLLPSITEIYIKNNDLEKAKMLLEKSDNNEAYRLYAWIARLEGDEDNAEKLMVKYRRNWLAPKETGIYCKLVDLTLPSEPPDDIQEVFKIISGAYDETRDLIKEIDVEYGLDQMTCVETGCQDCCRYTYPYITYIEYMYIKDWLDNQPDEVKNNIRDTSRKVWKMYRDKYNIDPPFLNKESIKKHVNAYPKDFIFDCPFLGDNKCNVYFNRPFTCRAYGFGSSEGALYKGCNYFFEQLKSATKLNSVRKVINMKSFFDFAGKVDKKLVGKKVAAPIPVWFAEDHDATVKRLKEVG